MAAKFERCVMKVKASNVARGTNYNPFAICHASVGGKLGGTSTGVKKYVNGKSRTVYEGRQGGLFYVQNGKKVYLSDTQKRMFKRHGRRSSPRRH